MMFRWLHAKTQIVFIPVLVVIDITLHSGQRSLILRAIPQRVPPVPAPETTISTLPAIITKHMNDEQDCRIEHQDELEHMSSSESFNIV